MLTNRHLLGFNGELRDPLTGYYLLGNGYRAYNPVLMRFNSPDKSSPFGEGGINAYAYCAGDPVNRTDPTGHLFKTLRRWLGLNRTPREAAGTTQSGVSSAEPPPRRIYGPNARARNDSLLGPYIDDPSSGRIHYVTREELRAFMDQRVEEQRAFMNQRAEQQRALINRRAEDQPPSYEEAAKLVKTEEPPPSFEQATARIRQPTP